MIYIKSGTDASNIYRPSSAAERLDLNGTSVMGNLADMMRNNTCVRQMFIAPSTVEYPAPLNKIYNDQV